MNLRRNIINILALMAASAFLFQSCATLFKGSSKYEDFRSREKRGAQIKIIKTDGTKIDGELIAIKQYSKLFFESISGIGESIDVSEVKSIKIVKGSLAPVGAVLGMLIGAYAGGAIGYGGSEPHTDAEYVQAYFGAFFVGGVGAVVAGASGAAIGSLIPIRQEFRIEGKPLAEIIAALDKLRSKARFPDYQ